MSSESIIAMLNDHKDSLPEEIYLKMYNAVKKQKEKSMVTCKVLYVKCQINRVGDRTLDVTQKMVEEIIHIKRKKYDFIVQSLNNNGSCSGCDIIPNFTEEAFLLMNREDDEREELVISVKNSYSVIIKVLLLEE